MAFSVQQWVGLSLLGAVVIYLFRGGGKSEGERVERAVSYPSFTPKPSPSPRIHVEPVPGPDQPDTLKPGERDFEEYGGARTSGD